MSKRLATFVGLNEFNVVVHGAKLALWIVKVSDHCNNVQ